MHILQHKIEEVRMHSLEAVLYCTVLCVTSVSALQPLNEKAEGRATLEAW